jgi:hypothetical protein
VRYELVGDRDHTRSGCLGGVRFWESHTPGGNTLLTAQNSSRAWFAKLAEKREAAVGSRILTAGLFVITEIEDF